MSACIHTHTVHDDRRKPVWSNKEKTAFRAVGKCTFKNDKQTIETTFEKPSKEIKKNQTGNGAELFPNNTSYKGRYLKGKRHGYGTFTKTDGDTEGHGYVFGRRADVSDLVALSLGTEKEEKTEEE